jgi:hypothetical protein
MEETFRSAAPDRAVTRDLTGHDLAEIALNGVLASACVRAKQTPPSGNRSHPRPLAHRLSFAAVRGSDRYFSVDSSLTYILLRTSTIPVTQMLRQLGFDANRRIYLSWEIALPLRFELLNFYFRCEIFYCYAAGAIAVLFNRWEIGESQWEICAYYVFET